ncbi:hypothetical protein AMK59_3557, partial [Oryctes borbonicus]
NTFIIMNIYEICVIYFTFLLIIDVQAQGSSKDQTPIKNSQLSSLVCPSRSKPVPFLALPCGSNNDCRIMGAGSTSICCRTRCVEGEPLTRQNEIVDSSAKQVSTSKLEKLIAQTEWVCPNKVSQIPFIALPCSSRECEILGIGFVCCRNRCVQGVPAPVKIEMPHEPILFGLVERICPVDPIPELSEIRECKSDLDCDPRICCPDKPNAAGQVKFYCRTAAANLDKLPAPRMIVEPLKTAVSYMQCTPPPPANIDLFPKPCESSFDCFPNLCCQENGRRYCRPPKRSVLALLAELTQRLGTS